MPEARPSFMRPLLMLIALLACGARWPGAMAADAAPAAPTIADAHQLFDVLVANKGVTALYETRGKNGDILGHESFPVNDYRGVACRSGLTLRNGVRIAIDWSVVEKAQLSDGTLSILRGPDVQFTFFHMVAVEGGVMVEPSNAIPRLVFGINDEISRNRLVKAIDLLSATCRAKSKFD
jgi:hypothetical protein